MGGNRSLGLLLVLALLLLPVSLCRRSDSLLDSREDPSLEAGYRIDVNHAGCAELTLLPGIGPRLAEEIVRYRENRNPFKDILDLEGVKGLGPVKIARMEPWIEFKTEPPLHDRDNRK